MSGKSITKNGSHSGGISLDDISDIDNCDIDAGELSDEIDSVDGGDDTDDEGFDDEDEDDEDEYDDESDDDDEGEDGVNEAKAKHALSKMKKFDFIYSNEDEDIATKEIIIVKNEDRITSHMLSKTEITEAVSIRCAQIQKNPIVFVDIEGMDDPIAMAKKEINERKCPLVLRRFIGHYNKHDYFEYWDVNEMTRPYILSY